MKCPAWITVAILMLGGTAALAAPPARVILLPFESAGESERAWVAKAVQQNLLAELSRVNSVQVVTANQPAKDQEAAVKAAQDAKADYVVWGSYQAVEGDLRITGQVLDANKKETVAGLKATGSVRDLFGLEDVIASQVKRALPQAVAVAQPEMLKQPPAAPPGIEPNGPIGGDVNDRVRQLEVAIDQTIDRLRYAEPYDNSYYSNYGSYYSPFYYPSVYYYPTYRNHNHHHYPHVTPHSGFSVSGSYTGNHVNANFSFGGGSAHVGGMGSHAPVGNYANFGRMTAAPMRR